MEIDIRTLVLVYVITSVMDNGLMFIIWRLYRKHYRGLTYLLANMSLMTVGSMFLLLRGVIPEIPSIIFTNLFSVAGLLFTLKGLELFFDCEKKRIYNYALFAAFMCSVFYFSMVDNNLFARNIALSAMIVLFNGQSAGLLYRVVKADDRKYARFTAGVLLGYCVFSVSRIIALVIIPQSNNDFFSSGIVNSIAMIGFSIFNILITAGYIMMVIHRHLSEAQTEKEKYIRAFHYSPYALLLTRAADGRIFEVNEGFTKITGYSMEEAVGRTTIDLGLWVEPEDRAAFVKTLMSREDMHESEMKFRVKDGSIMIGQVSAKRIFAFGEDCLLTSVSDITELIKIRERLEKMALHDALTGLPNRQLFFDRAAIAMANARREKEMLAVISLDVDGLKFVNDHWGHMAGDHVLITTGNRLCDLLRKGDTISRFGGDEFLILLNGVKNADDIHTTVKKIMETASMPLEVEGDCIAVTASLGIAIYPTDDTEIESLIRKSDKAMYYIKTHGRNGYSFYLENEIYIGDS